MTENLQPAKPDQTPAGKTNKTFLGGLASVLLPLGAILLAMLVGAILIPGMEAGLRMQATAAFIALSLAAGALWTLFGSSLPGRVTPYAYRIAAVVVGLFSVAAASGAIAG